jgi:TPR repeat protein
MRLLRCLCLLGAILAQPVFADQMSLCENIIRSGNETWAYKNCLPAAEDGNPKAQVLVGMALMTGIGVLENQELAVMWFKRASDQNYPGGMYRLGLAKISGIGTPKDEKGGMVLMQKAAAAGESRAKSFLDEIGVPVESVKAPPKRIKNECVGIGCGRPTDSFGR